MFTDFNMLIFAVSVFPSVRFLGLCSLLVEIISSLGFEGWLLLLGIIEITLHILTFVHADFDRFASDIICSCSCNFYFQYMRYFCLSYKQVKMLQMKNY